jgi:hypothetical protein
MPARLAAPLALALAALVGSPSPLAAADPAAAAPPGVDLRDEQGAVLVSADEIVAYDWPTHTLTLKRGVSQRLRGAKGRIAGSPFRVCVGGEPIYGGVFKSVISSDSSDAVVIVVDASLLEAGDEPPAPDQAEHETLRIGLGYPGEDSFTGDDPRGNGRVKAALAAAGKLQTAHGEIHLTTDAGHRRLAGAEAEAYRAANAFLEARLREAAALQPGAAYADVARSFTLDGGLQGGDSRRFVSILCPLIKIDVTFEQPPGRPIAADLKVVKVSKPYLERAFSD